MSITAIQLAPTLTALSVQKAQTALLKVIIKGNNKNDRNEQHILSTSVCI